MYTSFGVYGAVKDYGPVVKTLVLGRWREIFRGGQEEEKGWRTRSYWDVGGQQ